MSREITSHRDSALNEEITIEVLDEAGPGGANHFYLIENTQSDDFCKIKFQEGAVQDVGHNGISDESLIAVLIDRLEGFQREKFHCSDNEAALCDLRDALEALKMCTADRVARGVEGKALA